MRVFSERFAEAICSRLSAVSFDKSCSSCLRKSLADKTDKAFSLFCNWFLSDCEVTTRPVGLCVILMADSVLFTYCPPGPDAL